MPVRLLIVLLGLLSAAPLGYAFLNDSGATGLYAIPFVIALALAVIFKPELDWAYYTRYPPDLEKPVILLLETKQPAWYKRLTTVDRLALRRRTALTLLGLDFKPQGMEDGSLPGDIEALIAAQAARLTVGLSPKHAIPEPFEHIVVYRHPFPSPQFPDQFHASELYAEDGVIMLSLHQALPALLDPHEYFNIALYEWARAFELAWYGKGAASPTVPTCEDMLRDVLARPSSWVFDAVGLSIVDDLAVAQTLRLDFPEAFAKTYPTLASELERRLLRGPLDHIPAD